MTVAPPSLWTPLKRPAFRNLMAAMAVSNTGYWMQTVAAAYLMRLWTDGDPLMVSLVQTALFIPPALLLLPAGTWVDMLDRRKFMMFSQAWMMLAACAITALVLADIQSGWALLALLALFAVGFALNTPSQSAIWADMVGLKEVSQAVAIYSMTNNGARILGPSLSGVFVAGLGAAAVMAFNALTYLGVIAALYTWQAPIRPKVPRKPFLSLLFGAIAFARATPLYRAILIRGGIFFVVSAIVPALLPIKVPEAEDFGTVFSFMGLGAILAALSFPRLAHGHSREAIVATAVSINALALIGMSLVSSVLALGLMTALSGYTWFFVMSAMQVGAQMLLPDELRGRGLALLNLVLMSGYAFGSPLWGAVARLSSPSMAFAIAGGASLCALALTFRMKLPQDRTD
ncbi:MAG: MFS transporter [Rhodospirillaceae bacterium]|nr:MFS transporter [Rhodospirillaceae bacterium]